MAIRDGGLLMVRMTAFLVEVLVSVRWFSVITSIIIRPSSKITFTSKNAMDWFDHSAVNLMVGCIPFVLFTNSFKQLIFASVWRVYAYGYQYNVRVKAYVFVLIYM